MEDGKKLIASCSFGKDSLAAIVVSEEHGHHIDEAVYCRIMFDSETSAELPEHEEFIHCKAIPLLESRYGIKTTIVQAEKSYCDYFYTKYETGGKVGRIYGFPFLRGAWCNTRLKVRPINNWQKCEGEYTAVVGIAADEKKRIDRKTVENKFLPLVKYEIDERGAFEKCKRGGAFISGIQRRPHTLGVLVLPQSEDCGITQAPHGVPGAMGKAPKARQGQPGYVQTLQIYCRP